jgi:hypothetical protein
MILGGEISPALVINFAKPQTLMPLQSKAQNLPSAIVQALFAPLPVLLY